MEEQLHRPSHGQDYHYEDLRTAGLHSVTEGEREGEHNQHGEKKSVLKKVKEKAKKIKDTVKKHGHGHGHDHAYEEDDDASEEMVNDPDVHGAPMYESAVITGTNLPMQTDLNLEKPMDTREDRYSRPTVMSEVYEYPDVVDEGESARSGPGGLLGMDLPFEGRLPEHKNPLAFDVEEPTVKIGPLVGLEEDPHLPKGRPGGKPASNYGAKVVDPTGEGGKEAEVAPLVQRLDNLNIHGESEPKPQANPKSYTGSHDQFAPQTMPTTDYFNPESNPLVGGNPEPDSAPKISDPTQPESMPRDSVAGKISSATSTIAGKVVSVKNVVALKMGYGGQPHEAGEDLRHKTAADYGHEVAEKLAPVYGKLAGAGTAVLSKVRGGGGAEHESGGEAIAKGTDKGVSMKEYLAEKLRPGEEDKVLSEVITEALHKKQPMGRETATPVAENAAVAGGQTSDTGVVDRLKGAVGSWLGKSAGTQTAGEFLSHLVLVYERMFIQILTEIVVNLGLGASGVGQREEEVMSKQKQQQQQQQSSGN
ncbi:Low-temperature-induced protein [Sesamum alatum]|uniref:Low-temperature-induced protein n=1 Tax=Sesamum alatum TaxID=300844 RepID=A0AAE2CR68_9LAMI|nr:Low-temperature-induced protein [Sesamum alatum]